MQFFFPTSYLPQPLCVCVCVVWFQRHTHHTVWWITGVWWCGVGVASGVVLFYWLRYVHTSTAYYKKNSFPLHNNNVAGSSSSKVQNKHIKWQNQQTCVCVMRFVESVQIDEIASRRHCGLSWFILDLIGCQCRIGNYKYTLSAVVGQCKGISFVYIFSTNNFFRKRNWIIVGKSFTYFFK